MDVVAGFASLAGLLMLLLAVIPAARRTIPHLVRNGLLLLVSGIVLSAIFVDNPGEAGISGASVGASTGSSAAAPSAVAAPVPVSAPAPTDPRPAGTPLEVDRWILQAGSAERSIVFRRSIGNEFLGETADAGFVFALVPMYVKSNTNRTEPLSFPTWKLQDTLGNEYTIQTLADMYLTSGVLDVTDIPPGSTRFGYLVFQVNESVTSLTLAFGNGRNQRSWVFSGL